MKSILKGIIDGIETFKDPVQEPKVIIVKEEAKTELEIKDANLKLLTDCIAKIHDYLKTQPESEQREVITNYIAEAYLKIFVDF